MDNEFAIKADIEKKICALLENIGNIPEYLIPKINVSNDSAFPFIDIGFDGSLYYVVRERGIEIERIRFLTVDSLLFKVFKSLTFAFAMDEEKKYRESNGGYSLQKIFDIQNELMKKANPNWTNTN